MSTLFIVNAGVDGTICQSGTFGVSGASIQNATSKQLWHTCNLRTSVGAITIDEDDCYMKLQLHGPTSYVLWAPNSGTSDQKNAAIYGSIKITQLT